MQLEVLALVVGLLDDAGVPHMLTGSFASTFHGEPRMTRDIDLVIDPTIGSLRRFVASLDPDRFYVGDSAAAFRERDMFNVIDMATGWKVDLIIRKDRPFSMEEFRRRMPVSIGGVETFVATAEDTVLAKLEWCLMSGSDRQFTDVVAVAMTQMLDWDYLERWARQLGVERLLDKVLEAASAEGGPL